MTKSDYKNKRKELCDEAQNLINSGSIDKANEKMQEIRDLDATFENEAHAQADLKALSGEKIGKGFSSAVNFGNGESIKNEKPTDVYSSLEYRRAFMNHIVRGKEIPAKFRNANEATLSTDAGVIVPTPIYEQIFFKLDTTGKIYSRVFKTAYPAALLIPVATVKPEAKWVDEDKGSDRQKFTLDKIQFSGYKLECRTAFSLFMSVTALEKFESQFVSVISEAMIKAIEKAIISGSGTGAPEGILTKETENKVEIPAGEGIEYKTFVETEAKLPSAYDGPDTVYLMTKETFMSYFGITDTNGQPIARINAGLDGKPSYNILGREVIPADGYMSNYSDSVEEDTTVAAVFNLKDYILNEVMGVQISRYTDPENDQTVIKAVMLADGKVIDDSSLVKVVKKSA